MQVLLAKELPNRGDDFFAVASVYEHTRFE